MSQSFILSPQVVKKLNELHETKRLRLFLALHLVPCALCRPYVPLLHPAVEKCMDAGYTSIGRKDPLIALFHHPPKKTS
jgi:hypothetical protein